MVSVPVRTSPVGRYGAGRTCFGRDGEPVEPLLDDGPVAVAKDLQGGRGLRRLGEGERVVFAEARYREQRIVAVSGLADGYDHGSHAFAPERERALARIASVG